MQILPVNLPPVVPSAQSPQTIGNVLPHVQAQAVAPISGQAVGATNAASKPEKSRAKDATDDEGGRRKKRGRPAQDEPQDPNRGHSLDISV